MNAGPNARRERIAHYLRMVLERTGLSAEALGRRSGVAGTTVTRALDPLGETVMGNRSLDKIEQTTGIAFEPPLQPAGADLSAAPGLAEATMRYTTAEGGDCVLLPEVVDASALAAAGPGAVAATLEGVENHWSLARAYVQDLLCVADPAKAFVYVAGDRALSPEIQVGDRLIVDMGQNGIDEGGYFLVAFAGKVVLRHLSTTDHAGLCAVQTTYPTPVVQRVAVDRLAVIGRVVGQVRRL